MRPPAAHFRKAAATVLFAGAALLLPTAAQAGTVPSGFQESVVYSGLTEPTSLAFSPDGRVFVAEKSGIIKVYDNLSDTTPEVFADLTTEVHDFWDRGLLGMALDPDFPAKPYVYVLYTLDALPGGTAPKWGGTAPSDGCPTPPGPTADGCVVTGRLAKLTATGNKATAQTNLITDWCQQFPSHSVGDLAFGADGSLYVSGGDGANFNAIDWGQNGSPVNPCGDPPGGVGGTMTLPTAEGGSLRSQDVRTPGDPTGLNGSLLRVDPETGQAMPGNPMSSSLDANARRIVAYGMRNPFRFTVRPGTNEVWVGDVGLGTWEEIDRVGNPIGSTPYNFGWPCYEGASGSSARQSSWNTAGANLCESLYGEGPSAVTAPYYGYKHTALVVPGETCPTGSSSISGLSFYQSGPFPNTYNGALFFADYSRNCIWAMMPGANGLPDPSNIQTFDAGAHGPVNLKVGPEGSLFFADLTGGKIWRIGHAVGDQPPVAAATATPQNGPGPLDVQLSAAGSSDPDPGDTLSYSWDLDGDGQFGDSTLQAPTHVYTEPGTHIATVRVSDPDGASDTESVSIQVDNAPPTATITTPLSTQTWAVGDLISYAATATDPQQGTLPASAYSWSVIIHHCPSNCHTHQLETINGKTGGTFVAPDHEYPSWLEFRLTVTDAGGLTDTESVEVHPKTVSLEIKSLPEPGFEVAIDGASGSTPFTATVIKGSNNTIAAPAQTVGGHDYAFGAWSDGGEGAHNVVADHDLSLTAVFGPPAAPTISSTSPASPSSDNDPEVSGSVGSDFPGQVKIYASANCNGSPAAIGTPAQFTGGGITVPVPSDAVTSLSAATANAAGDSTCSKAISYTEDSTPPAAPAIAATTPPSPANDNSPQVSGSAENGSTVRVFKSANCSGAAAVTGSAAQFATGLTVAVSGDSTTSLTATATDAVGNVSACSSAFSYVEDSTPPATPVIAASSPPSPANDNGPELSGNVEAGSTVALYKSAGCSGSAAATGGSAQFSSGLTVAVADDATTSVTARATDAAGNVSPCSKALSYTEDSTPPATPAIAATSPASPANNNDPEVSGSAESGSTVRVFASAGCSGAAAATGTASQFAGGLTLTVADDSTTSLTANATDAAGNESACSPALAYTEDSTPPAAPAITATTPASPANDNDPEVSGSAEAGSTVRVFKSATCAGTATVTGTAAQFSSGLTVAVIDDTDTVLTATATDAAGNESACSSALSYTEDSTPPAAPAIAATAPPSPANDNSPNVSGSVGAGSPVNVELYATAGCTGTPTTATVATFTGAGIVGAVPDNQTTAFSARTRDAAGNPSACSGSFSYVEDSTLPEAPTIAATVPASPANENNPMVIGTAEAGSTVHLYESAGCSGTAVATGTAAQFATGIAVSVGDNTTTSLRAQAEDDAKNSSPCSEPIEYVEDSIAPAAPSIAASSPASPANNNDPALRGDGAEGSTVLIYESASCSGPVAATGTAAQFGSGLTLPVADNSNTSFAATATDAAGNVSACSSPLAYVEDSTAPARPALTGTAPSSPANDNNPRLSGSAEASATVRLFESTDCSGPVAATGTGAMLGGGLGVTVGGDTAAPLTASATDAAGNVSACSSALSYVEDSTPPQTTITKSPRAHISAPPRKDRKRAAGARAGFSFSSDDPAAHFLCRIDGAAFSSCTSPATRAKLKLGPHRFSVRAVDAAGNTDPTPAARKFVVVETVKSRPNPSH